MAIYKRGGVYWYSFVWNGSRVQESTKQGNPNVARTMESTHRTRLALGEVGIRERKQVTLTDFLKKQFLPFVESKCASKPQTVRYYQHGASKLLESDFASLYLSQITDQHTAAYAAKHSKLSPSTINRDLRTLVRALSLATEWGVIDRKPKITLAKGERQRDRVLTEAETTAYLAACPQPWRDCATIILNIGMRPGEVFSLRWENIIFSGSAGLLQITHGKSRAARRMLPLVPAVFNLLQNRYQAARNPTNGWVFPANTKSGHFETGCAKNQHEAALESIANKAKEQKLPTPVKPFPPYTFRHTALTRLGEKGCDPYTLARIAGHSSITMTQRYVHPEADAIERAFAKLAVPQLTATAGK